MCCDSRGLSRLGVLLGLLALCVLLVAFIGGSWLYTKEPIILPSSDLTTITFRIGLWRACPSIKRINLSTYTPAPSCSLIKYNDWNEIKSSDLGIWMQLDLAPVFITRMRTCTILCAVSVALLLLGVLLSLIGHCSRNNKTLIGSGMYILAALFLGTSLVTFASALSETLLETSQYHTESALGTPYDYRYGWCFFTASAAFIFIKIAVVFSLSGYLHRFPTDDEMVRVMVPGADRKLREHQSLSECIASCGYNRPTSRQYDPLISSSKEEPSSKYDDAERGPLLKKTPPDVCSTSNTMKRSNKDRDDDDDNDKFEPSSLPLPLPPRQGECYAGDEMLAGQTVPITIKKYSNNIHHHQHSSAAACAAKYFISPNNKFGTLPSALPNSRLRNPYEDSGGSLEGASFKTLQYKNKQRKKVVISDTVQTHVGGSITDLTGKRLTNLSLSGSAV